MAAAGLKGGVVWPRAFAAASLSNQTPCGTNGGCDNSGRHAHFFRSGWLGQMVPRPNFPYESCHLSTQRAQKSPQAPKSTAGCCRRQPTTLGSLTKSARLFIEQRWRPKILLRLFMQRLKTYFFFLRPPSLVDRGLREG